MKIQDIRAIEVLDSRGNPTILSEVILSDGLSDFAIVPSGASTGKREALELRDGDERYLGKGVRDAIKNVDRILEVLKGVDVRDQSLIDELIIKLDGTHNFSNLGANAALGVSMAAAKVAAKSLKIPLYQYLGGINATLMPIPLMNIINGGSHADNKLDFQEYMIVPHGFNTFTDALRAGAEIYHHLKNVLKRERCSIAVGDEGGFSPNIESNDRPLDLIMHAIREAGYEPGGHVSIALDVASSEFYDNGIYRLEGKELDSKKLIDHYEFLVHNYPIVSIEDGLAEDDFEGWASLTSRLGHKVQLVGDDLFVTNTQILKEGIEKGLANSILIKPNQIGTITQTIDAINVAKRAGYNCIMSHRSGESEDTFIADFAVAMRTGQIKTGSVARSERIAKYNRLLYIESLGRSTFKGKDLYAHRAKRLL